MERADQLRGQRIAQANRLLDVLRREVITGTQNVAERVVRHFGDADVASMGSTDLDSLCSLRIHGAQLLPQPHLLQREAQQGEQRQAAERH